MPIPRSRRALHHTHLLGVAFVAHATAATLHEVPFRSSLTATVIISSGRGHSKPSSPLACREVALRWSPAPGARRYAVYVSARLDGPWAALPSTNVCGPVRWSGATGVVDVEPTGGAPAVARRLYYKVFALRGGSAADESPIDVTEPVAVELP